MCLFCERAKNPDAFLYENEHVYVIHDQFPVSDDHVLIITKRHIQTYFECTADELEAINDALFHMKEMLDRRRHPDGYNIGINNNACAGQSIMHLHVHLIPRYEGDTPNPKGGVRGVIPGKQSY